MPLEAFSDDKIGAEYDIAIEAWGERGWAAVARNCRWTKVMGNKIECPPAQEPR
jgi:hypothetical protein